MKNILKQNWFTILAGGMLLLAIPTNLWPYSYFQILRWLVTIVALYGVHSAYKVKNNKWVLTYGVIAVLFNPIAPIYFTKETWKILDLVTSGVFFISLKK